MIKTIIFACEPSDFFHSLHIGSEKEKIYSRQVSAPILKRKSSRFGLGQFLSSGTSNTANVAQPSHSQYYHHLQINCAPHTGAGVGQSGVQQVLHTAVPTSSGTTPTTPNLMSLAFFQQQQQHLGYSYFSGAPGRSSACLTATRLDVLSAEPFYQQFFRVL